MTQTKSLDSRSPSPPVSLVINPEECSVWSNKRLWSGVAPSALLESQSPSRFLQVRTVPAAMGKSQGKKQTFFLFFFYCGGLGVQQQNLGPIKDWVDAEVVSRRGPGTWWLEKPGDVQQSCMWSYRIGAAFTETSGKIWSYQQVWTHNMWLDWVICPCVAYS